MEPRSYRAYPVLFGALTALVLSGSSVLEAGESSSATLASLSSLSKPSTVELLAGGPAGDRQLVAGVRVRLKPGWKTYWRNPGQSGMPPSFDWSGSSNVADAEVLFPAPRRYTANGETVYGYHEEVIFPVRITPAKAGDPVKLSLSMTYAICRDICMPIQAEAAAELGTDMGGGQNLAEIERYEKRVPQDQVPGLDIAAIRSAFEDGKEALNVELKVADESDPVEIFIENAPAGVSLGASRLVASEADRRLYRISVDKNRTGQPIREAKIALTVVQGEKALARTVKVD